MKYLLSDLFGFVCLLEYWDTSKDFLVGGKEKGTMRIFVANLLYMYIYIYIFIAIRVYSKDVYHFPMTQNHHQQQQQKLPVQLSL